MYFDNIIKNIMNIINDKINAFELKYHVSPKFIKIPSWINQLLFQYNKEYADSFYICTEGPFIGVLMNLVVCDTPSIIDIEDIDVF